MTEQKQNSSKEKNWFDLIQDAYRKARPYAAILIAVALMTASAVQDLKWKVGVLISLGIVLVYLSIDLYKLITAKVADIKTTLNDIEENIRNVEDPLYKAAYGDVLGKPEVQVAMKMYKASKEAAKQLKHPKQVFKNFEDYTNELMSRIDQMILSKKGAIYAACGEKAWEDDGTKRWFNRNFDALKSNIAINRIFVEEIGWNKVAAEQQMQMQANNGINVRIAAIKGLKNHPLLSNIPKGFGFVIFDFGNNKPEVIVHNDPATEKSVLFDDSMIVGQFIATFNELSSESYSKKILSDNHNNSAVNLEKEIIQRTEELTMHVKHLLDHRFSNLQLSFINWRFGSELNKIRSVLNGELPILAFDKYQYLSDIFGHLQRQLKKGDKYQTISTIDIWSGKNIGSSTFLRSTGIALKSEATIERVVFVDSKKMKSKQDSHYHENILQAIELFENFSDKEHVLHTLGFFIDDMNGDYHDILQHAPVALISESGNSNRLGIFTHYTGNADNDKVPILNLKFYVENSYAGNDYDQPCRDFMNNFDEIKGKSIDIVEMRKRLFELYPNLKSNLQI